MHHAEVGIALRRDESNRERHSFLGGHGNAKRPAIERHVVQNRAAAGIAVAALHRVEEDVGRQSFGANHRERLAEGPWVFGSGGGVEVAVVVGDGMEERLANGGAVCVHGVPEAIIVEAIVGEQPDGREVRAVVADLEETDG